MSDTDVTPHEPRIVIVLVHGTFAPRAPWTIDGSQLRATIASAITDVHFEVFPWTGANSHEARITAGGELSATVQNVRGRFPRAAVFVIAHSHGGNIALYAARDRDCAAALTGIVTMGTPFLWFRPRHVPRAFSALVGSGYALAVIGLVFGAASVLPGPLRAWLIGLIPLFALALYNWLGQTAIPRSIYFRCRRWIAERQNAVISRAPADVSFTGPLLNLQMSLDEARIHLSVVGFMAQMTVGMIPPIVVFNLLFFGPAPAWLILPILGAFAAAMTMILRGHRFGFGRESALDNLVADVRVGAEPPESRAILQDLERLGEAPFAPHRWPWEYLLPANRRHWLLLPAVAQPARRPDLTSLRIASLRGSFRWSESLRHSRLYGSEDVGKTVAAWLVMTTERRSGAA
jgi:hypothetical protein